MADKNKLFTVMRLCLDLAEDTTTTSSASIQEAMIYQAGYDNEFMANSPAQQNDRRRGMLEDIDRKRQHSLLRLHASVIRRSCTVCWSKLTPDNHRFDCCKGVVCALCFTKYTELIENTEEIYCCCCFCPREQTL